jgi:hypothetical protein
MKLMQNHVTELKLNFGTQKKLGNRRMRFCNGKQLRKLPGKLKYRPNIANLLKPLNFPIYTEILVQREK